MRFNEKVWKLCSRVPRGKVTTYSEIAHALDTRAYRAVGNALHSNPYAPKVPCHRVVNSDGRLGGFGGGTKKKAEMLRKEGVKIRRGRIINFYEVLHKF